MVGMFVQWLRVLSRRIYERSSLLWGNARASSALSTKQSHLWSGLELKDFNSFLSSRYSIFNLRLFKIMNWSRRFRGNREWSSGWDLRCDARSSTQYAIQPQFKLKIKSKVWEKFYDCSSDQEQFFSWVCVYMYERTVIPPKDNLAPESW